MSRLLVAVVVALAATYVHCRMAYILPDGVDQLVPNLKTNFKCDGRRYGYYADVENDCKVFHVCQPIADADGKLLEVAQFTFVCGNQTVFNQESLTCTLPEDAVACQDAPALYDATNANFGVIPEKKI